MRDVEGRCVAYEHGIDIRRGTQILRLGRCLRRSPQDFGSTVTECVPRDITDVRDEEQIS